jgi:hypothetical protein
MGDVYLQLRAWLAGACFVSLVSACAPDVLHWLWQHSGEWPHADYDAGSPPAPCPPGAILHGDECAWTYSQIVASENHTCGLRAETGEVVCWGEGPAQLNATGDVRFSQLAIAAALHCGIRRDTGAISCWAGSVPSDLPTTGRYTRITVYEYDAYTEAGRLVCAIRADDGHVECWGDDTSGQISNIPRDSAFSEVSAGGSFVCAIRRDDASIVCWGSGADALEPPTQPMCSLAGASFFSNMCGLSCAGQAVCWGASEFATTPPSDVSFRQIAHGLFLACGIRAADGGIQCWSGSRHITPEPGVAYEQLAVGGSWWGVNANTEDTDSEYPLHLCALRAEDHRVECWGTDFAGQVSGAPSFTRYRQVTAGQFLLSANGRTESKFCALREADGRPLCWGRPFGGEPVSAYSAIALSCGLRADDSTTDCWPEASAEPLLELDSFAGSCGLRRSNHTPLCSMRWQDAQSTPAPDVALHGLTAGDAYACAIRDADDLAVCWGGGYGPARQPPTDVRFRSLQAQHARWFDLTEHTCGIRMDDGFVQCWGDAFPTQPTPPSDVPMLRLSTYSDCGILADTHEIACWRDGTLRVEPSQRGVAFREVAGTSLATCGIREVDDVMTCWGNVQWNPRSPVRSGTGW